VSIDFHRLIEALDHNQLIKIDYIDYIDCLPMIDFYPLGTQEGSGILGGACLNYEHV